MRKVHFPLELDVWPFLSPDLFHRTRSAANKLRDIHWARKQRQLELQRAHNRQRRREVALRTWDQEVDGELPTPTEWDQVVLDDGDLLTPEQEEILHHREQKEYQASLDPDLVVDVGCNPTGLYDLVGLVTHQGPSTEQGRYSGWVKQMPTEHTKNHARPMWCRFNDEKIDLFPQETIEELQGGLAGNSIAYILLYRSKTLD